MTAKSGGVTVASQILRISQPSLSSQLKTLEDSLGVKLFRKVGRKNQLTHAGNVVFGYCRRMYDASEELKEIITESLPTASRRISIGVVDEIKYSFVVGIVNRFIKKHGSNQRPRVTMVSGNVEELSEKLRFHELDAIVSPLNLVDREIVDLVKIETPVRLFSAKKIKNSKLKNKNNGALFSELNKDPNVYWVMPSAKFKLRAEIDKFMEIHQIKCRVIFESDVLAATIRAVRDDLGFALLPSLYAADELLHKNIQAFGPKEGFWKYGVTLSCHNQNREDPLIQLLASSFTENRKS